VLFGETSIIQGTTPFSAALRDFSVDLCVKKSNTENHEGGTKEHEGKEKMRVFLL